MPSLKNIKPPRQKRVDGAITREEILRRHKTANEMLLIAQKMEKPVYEIVTNTHTGETIKRLAHA